jgi:hypothetical protein
MSGIGKWHLVNPNLFVLWSLHSASGSCTVLSVRHYRSNWNTVYYCVNQFGTSQAERGHERALCYRERRRLF